MGKHTIWRYLVTPPLDGARNMAIDEAMLYALADGQGIPTLRFYQWQPPCLSLGYNQHWSEVDEAALTHHGYYWTRRATGGKAILHTDEVTYSLIIPQNDPRVEGGILESYRRLSYGLLRGLEKLGVQAEQAGKEEVLAQRRAAKGGPVCFDTPSRYEITWQGKKLIGSAQLRRKQIVLQHGTLPLQGNLNRIIDVLNLSPEERQEQRILLRQRAVTLEQALGRVVAFDEAVDALKQGFSEMLNISLEASDLYPQEQALATQLLKDQYASEAWLKRV